MSDKGKVISGLVVFVVLVTFPVWYTLGAGADGSRPELELPTDGTRCAEDKEYMTANHMGLLDEWRNAVVREGERDYTSKAFGTQFEMSLSRTCMKCHNNSDTFCNRCHTYADVKPLCWDCHFEPKGN